MFAGVISREDGLPWGEAGMTTEKWKQLPVRMVQIRSLIMTQAGIMFESIINPGPSYSGDIYPHVVCFEGNNYLEDGHHRVVRAALDSLGLISARVLYL